MEGNFLKEFDTCKSKKEYLGNSLAAYYMFKYASENEEFAKKLLNLIKESINNINNDYSFSTYQELKDSFKDGLDIIKVIEDFI